MILWLTLILSGLFVLFALKRCKRDFADPFFVFTISTSASLAIVAVNASTWDIVINIQFLFCIFIAYMGWLLGDTIIKHLRTAERIRVVRFSTFPSMSEYPYRGMIILSILLGTVYLINRISIAQQAPSGNIASKLRYIYDRNAVDKLDDNFFINRVFEFEAAVAYISFHRIALNMKNQKRLRISLIIPIVMYFACIISRTDRNYFLRFAIYGICLWVIIYQSENTRAGNKKLIKTLFKVLILIVLLFYFLGLTKQYKSRFIDSISSYAASGLINFNLILSDYPGEYWHGQFTFSTFFGALGHIFGFSFESRSLTSLGGVVGLDGFIRYFSTSGRYYFSNIYSAFHAYFRDFGYAGVFIFPLIYGAFFRILKKKADGDRRGYSAVLYSMLLYPVVYMPITDQLIRRLHLGFVFEIFTVYIVYVIIYGTSRAVTKRVGGLVLQR